jgi:hypothetical protein
MRGNRGGAGFLLVGLLLSFPAGTPAQTLLWAGYGQNADDATGVATGESLTAGLGRFGPAAGLAGAVGVPLDPDASMRWGTVSAWFDRRATASPWGVAGGVSLFAFGDPVLDRTGAGSIAFLDGYHVLALAPAELRFRVGARHGLSAGAGNGVDGEDVGGTSQRLLGRAGTELGVRAGALDLRGELDHWRAEEGGYTQAGARIGLADRRFQAWAGVSRWFHEALSGTGWEVGARVPLARRFAVLVRGGVQGQEILFQVPPQRTWSVALQLRTGADPMVAALPASVIRDARRPVTLTLPAAALPGDPTGAAPPGVAGTFSGWQTIPMRRAGDFWEVELVLEPGVHEYSFVTAAGEWFVPQGTPGRKPDGFGGQVALLIVQ